jgi:hypothetical protein
MMSRIEVSNPPGVSICNTTIRLPLARAASRALVTYRDVAGPMAPLISRTVATAGPAVGAAASCSAGWDAAGWDVGGWDAALPAGWDVAAGGAAARTEIGISTVTAVQTITAKPARTALTRSWERAEQAFTLLTLLPSYAARSRCYFSLLISGESRVAHAVDHVGVSVGYGA